MPSESAKNNAQEVAQRRIAAHTDRLVEELIHDGTIIQPNWWASQRSRFWIFAVMLIVSFALSIAYQYWLLGQTGASKYPNSADLAYALIAATAALFAYYQWIDSRRENSIDVFYNRIGLVNERYYEWAPARQLVPHFWGPTNDEDEFQRRMYVYLELDNLEYMIFRYQLGFVRKPLFRRAVRTFSSRCESRPFGELAKVLVDGAGYDTKTVEIANILVAQAAIN